MISSPMVTHHLIDTAEKPGRLQDIMHSCNNVVVKCLDIQAGQTVLIVTDTEVSPLVYHAMAAAVHSAGGIPVVSMMRPLPHANAEPPDAIAAAMRESDVTIALVSKSITHTRAREIATQDHKKRYMLIPAVTEDMLMRGASTADFALVKEISRTIAKTLSAGSNIRLTCDNGSDLSLSIVGRPFKAYYGECLKPGEVSLFPGGEVNTFPVEESINGRVVFDSFMMGVGLLEKPIIVDFKEGIAISISGGREADQLKRLLESTNSPDAFRFGEFAVGTNYKARTLGSAFEDKEVYGTVHIALGSGVAWPKYYKPKYHVPIHLDGVLSSPTVAVDGTVVVTNRRILVAPIPPGH
jgi:2,5-dihydroxypyridine 5,6-dioxygenase